MVPSQSLSLLSHISVVGSTPPIQENTNSKKYEKLFRIEIYNYKKGGLESFFELDSNLNLINSSYCKEKA